MINNVYGFISQQRWLAAHNAWNTEIAPNQCKTVTELLNYGVRGFALDIWGDDEPSLHLQHGPGNLASWTDWSVVRDELHNWLTANDQDVVVLLFESYLTGPKPGDSNPSPLEALGNSLSRITGYKAGRTVQEGGLSHTTLAQLAKDNHRLFAFIEKEPQEGGQDLFPVMRRSFTENMYGDDSLQRETWTNLRPGSDLGKELVFLNHFGNAPTGSQWDRNDPNLIVEHMEAFALVCGGDYPCFVSLDYIDWNDENRGPIQAMEHYLS